MVGCQRCGLLFVRLLVLAIHPPCRVFLLIEKSLASSFQETYPSLNIPTLNTPLSHLYNSASVLLALAFLLCPLHLVYNLSCPMFRSVVRCALQYLVSAVTVRRSNLIVWTTDALSPNLIHYDHVTIMESCSSRNINPSGR